jgi:hypothetical protein
VWLQTDDQYSQSVGIDFVQDKTTILDKYKSRGGVKGTQISRGQEYKRVCISLNGWRIEKLEVKTEPTEAPESLWQQLKKNQIFFLIIT